MIEILFEIYPKSCPRESGPGPRTLRDTGGNLSRGVILCRFFEGPLQEIGLFLMLPQIGHLYRITSVSMFC